MVDGNFYVDGWRLLGFMDGYSMLFHVIPPVRWLYIYIIGFEPSPDEQWSWLYLILSPYY